jgi:hypothetical protein
MQKYSRVPVTNEEEVPYLGYISYRSQWDRKAVYSALKCLNDNAGQPENLAAFFFAATRAAGFESYLLEGETFVGNGNWVNSYYCAVKIGGKMYFFDPHTQAEYGINCFAVSFSDAKSKFITSDIGKYISDTLNFAKAKNLRVTQTLVSPGTTVSNVAEFDITASECINGVRFVKTIDGVIPINQGKKLSITVAATGSEPQFELFGTVVSQNGDDYIIPQVQLSLSSEGKYEKTLEFDLANGLCTISIVVSDNSGRSVEIVINARVG